MALSRRSLLKRLAAGTAAVPLANALPAPAAAAPEVEQAIVPDVMPQGFVTRVDALRDGVVGDSVAIPGLVDVEMDVADDVVDSADVSFRHFNERVEGTIDVGRVNLAALSDLDVLYSSPHRDPHPFDCLVFTHPGIEPGTFYAMDTSNPQGGVKVTYKHVIL